MGILISLVIGACVGIWFAARGRLTMEALPAGVLGALGGLIGGALVAFVLRLIPFGVTALLAAIGAVLAVWLFARLTRR